MNPPRSLAARVVAVMTLVLLAPTASALAQASREDPALRELMLNTRAFKRGDEE